MASPLPLTLHACSVYVYVWPSNLLNEQWVYIMAKATLELDTSCDWRQHNNWFHDCDWSLDYIWAPVFLLNGNNNSYRVTTEDGRRRGWQRMRWMDGTAYSIDLSLNKLRERMKDWEASWAAFQGVAKSQTQLSDWKTLLKWEHPWPNWTVDHIKFIYIP